MFKKITNFFVIPLAIFGMLVLALYPNAKLNIEDYSTAGLELDYTVSDRVEDETTEEIEVVIDVQEQEPLVYYPVLGKSYIGFREAVGFKESRGDYFTVNSYGYLGKYQFGSETLKMIGIYNSNQFLFNPELQEKAFLANTERNKWILRKDIKRFEGVTINGIKVTESGILAAAHLAGPGSVKKFLRSYGTNNFSDAYGTTVKYYMKRFAGYDTSSVKPNRKAKARI